MTIVQTQQLSKVYGDFVALDQCSLHVDRGEVFGLLGPNGAGKTTLLRTLLGYLKPTSGWAKVSGYDVARETVKVRTQIAYLPGDAHLPRHMRGSSVLNFFSNLHPEASLARSLELAEELELDTRRRVGFMSTGMRQKLALCVVLAISAPIVILDEPTANLDPSVRRVILQRIQSAKNEGRTVIFSSHVLSEIEQVCDRVVFLRRGKLVHEQPMNQLKDQHRLILQLSSDDFEIPVSLQDNVRLVSHRQREVVLETSSDLAPLLDWLAHTDPKDVRLEPLGISAIYERVHGFHDMEPPEMESGVAEAAS